MIPEVNIETIPDTAEGVKTMIDGLAVGTRYILPQYCRYKWVKVEQEKKELSFSWSLEKNYYVAGSSGYVFPMAGGIYVKFFKTEAGAKRNLCKFLLQSLQISDPQ